MTDEMRLVPHMDDGAARAPSQARFPVRGESTAAPLQPIIAERRPLPWPNGWFALCPSEELRRGEVQIAPFMGSELVLYRTASGAACAVSPYCPHLGAHLGHGGKVEGEDLVCPFHGFAYGPGGACVRVPGGGKPPPAKLEQWRVQERSGMVMVWRDHLGREPDWEIPDFDTTGYSPGRMSRQDMGGYAHDLAENSADLNHFAYLHGFSDVAMRHEVDRHRMRFTLTARWHGVDIVMHCNS